MFKRKKMSKDNLENQELTNQEDNKENNQQIKSEDEGANEEKISQTEEIGKKLVEINDKYLRLYSDFENYRKRTSKEKIDMIKFAAEDTIKDLLPVVDDYERALEDIEKQDNIPATSKEGLQLVYTKLINILTQKGVKPIDAKGQKFDESIHEAITQFPASTEEEKGIVIEEVIKGYYMYEKVIRFSKVVVAI